MIKWVESSMDYFIVCLQLWTTSEPRKHPKMSLPFPLSYLWPSSFFQTLWSVVCIWREPSSPIFFSAQRLVSYGGEGQIPYDLTLNCNIINRRKKQTKYNQRHWGWEQSSSGQGGVGWGQWEEGIAGTTIKDTWTKSGEMVGVGEGGGFSWGGGEGRGEKAYNCNWITIKIKKKKRTCALSLPISISLLFSTGSFP